jgi:type I restriction-modification system DNA methylase subunit
MVYSSIYISGNLISQELIAKLDDEGVIGQRPADFGLESGARVRQEIANAWTDANDYWKIFKRKLDGLKDTERGTTDTRNQWMIPLLGILGYDVTYVSQAETINDKSYDISHRANNRDELPIMIVSAKDELDKKPEGNARYRMSPHALLQEYLNVTEHTYGLVSNGKLLRLLRDNGRITRLTYLEFNLEKIFEEDLYADFALLYRLLHASRMPLKQTESAESIIEKYYQDAIDAGTRIRGSLSKAVEKSIRIFANGLLQHPENNALRDTLESGNLDGLRFYQDQLRLVYRLLFIMTIEERGLVYPEQISSDQQRFSKIYNQFYSVQHIRNLSAKQHLVNGRQHQLYIRLWQNFFLYECQNFAAKLGLQALGSGIFEPGTMDLYANCKMNNDRLLEAIYHLSYFTDQSSGQLIRVNYGALNVEEFGSVYEGLLDYQAKVSQVNGIWQFDFVESSERSKSGSHYTPEELVQPLIKHSLDYLIQDKLKEKDPVEGLLNLKVCDVACGSGHILLSAARRIALELARVKYKEEQPSPAHLRWATRQVINRCIYGVDKNPLAVDLCKVAMWLEAHNPGEPLNFLDHHIKCGDAIVGLAHRYELENGIADEAFKSLPIDEKAIASSYLKRNKAERKRVASTGSLQQLTTEQQLVNTVEETMVAYKSFSRLPETTPEEITQKAIAYKSFIDGKGLGFLKAMADTQVAQFFIPKTEANKDYLMTDADYRLILSGYKGWQDRKVAKATAVAHEQRFFHWFIEFPEVFSEGGFDCILGNPPFRGGLYITNDNSANYTNYIKNNTSKAGSTTDLVAYFFRRNFSIISEKGFISLIGTNSISEGDTRETALQFILDNGGKISFAIKSAKWPGEATLHVSLIVINKIQTWNMFLLNNKVVAVINSWLSDSVNHSKPHKLAQIEQAFLGTTVYGKGFFISNEEKKYLQTINPKHEKFIKPFLNGDDVLNHPESKNSRYVLYFQGLNISYLQSNYPELYEFAHDRIFAERQKSSSKGRREKWWLYTSPADEIYKSIERLNFVIATCFTSKYPVFTILHKEQIFSNALVIICSDSFSRLGSLQSNLHAAWIQEYGSTLETRQRYAVSDIYNTFPFPNFNENIEKEGLNYFQTRNLIQKSLRIGLTDLYNVFHDRNTKIEEIDKLRNAQVLIDNSVLSLYNWNDILLKHDFYEMDNLPENDRIRFTIHPDARKEVLIRLLELNHKIHQEEIEAESFPKKTKSRNTKKPGVNPDQNQLF